MTEFNIPSGGKIIIVSDCHLDYFDGVAGYTSRERNRHMRDALLLEKDVDAVIFAGDMTFRNTFDGLPLDSLYEWKSLVIDPLTAAGIPAFAINASHDSMTPDEFRQVFGYDHNFAVIHGDAAYICLDTFAKDRDASGQTTPSDIDGDILEDALEIAGRSDIVATFAVCHFPSDGENLNKLMCDERITAVVAGHLHDNFITTVSDAVATIRNVKFDCGKVLLQTGHYSRANAKRICDGCGFKPFVPMMQGDGICVSALDGVSAVPDFSRTGSPWQYRVFARTAEGIESYMIFPEADYTEFTGEGNLFYSFRQPRTEGFGDRSYIKFTF